MRHAKAREYHPMAHTHWTLGLNLPIGLDLRENQVALGFEWYLR